MTLLLTWIAGLITGIILSCACMCKKPEIIAHEITDNPKQPESDCNGCFGAAGNDCQKCQERKEEQRNGRKI